MKKDIYKDTLEFLGGGQDFSERNERLLSV